MQGNTPIRHPGSSGPNEAPASPGRRTTGVGLSRQLGTRQRRSRYYVAGDREQLAKNDLFGKHWGFRDLRLRIWNALNRSGESTATRIASVLGITRQLAAYHLGRLEKKGLVSSQDRRYRVTRSSAVAERIDESKRNS